MKIIFIAGPYSGDRTKESIERNIRIAEQYALALSNKHIGFFCPHAHTEHFTSGKGSHAPEQFFYDMDIDILKRCDAVLAVPGWEASRGASNEIAWAKQNNLTIFYPKSTDDLGEVEKWYKG